MLLLMVSYDPVSIWVMSLPSVGFLPLALNGPLALMIRGNGQQKGCNHNPWFVGNHNPSRDLLMTGVGPANLVSMGGGVPETLRF